MRKRCANCGKEFEARQPHFKFCPDCFSTSQRKETPLLEQLLLTSYCDRENNFLKEVFIGIPEELAHIFAKGRLATKQLRDFYQKILRARNKAFLNEINVARPILYECRRDAAYQLKRGIIPHSFSKFLEHHLNLAERDEKMLDGFCQHLQSILAYFPKEKGGPK